MLMGFRGFLGLGLLLWGLGAGALVVADEALVDSSLAAAPLAQRGGSVLTPMPRALRRGVGASHRLMDVWPLFQVGGGINVMWIPDRARSFTLHKPVLPELVLDLRVGAHLSFLFDGLDVSLWVSPAVGYAFQAIPVRHLFTLGIDIGPGLSDGSLFVATYNPRLLVGREGDLTLIGFRQGIAGHFLFRSVSLELAHQLVRGTTVPFGNEFVMSLSFDPFAIARTVFTIQNSRR